MGEFGAARAVPNTNPSRTDLSSLAQQGRGAAAIGEALTGVGQQAMHVAAQQQAQEQQEVAALAKAQAGNAMLDDELETKVIVDDVRQRVAEGALDWRKASEEYDKLQGKRQARTVENLDPADHERYLGQLKRNRFAGLADVQGIAAGARRTEVRTQIDSGLDTLGKLAGQPDADVDKINAQAEAFVTLAEAAGIDRAAVAAKVQTFKDRNWQNHAQARAIAARENPEALARLEHDLAADDGYYAGRLDTDRRNVLLSQVLGRKDQLDRQAREAADRTEAAAERALKEFEGQISTGVMAPIETMSAWQSTVAVGTPEQRERFNALVQGEAELREVRKLAPIDQRAHIDELKARQ